MCYQVQCSKCGKRSWQGCGQHVDELFEGIPKEEICQCPRENFQEITSTMETNFPKLEGCSYD